MNDEVLFFAAINKQFCSENYIYIPIVALKLVAITILLMSWVFKIGDGYINANSVIRTKESHGKGLDIWAVCNGIFLLMIFSSYNYVIDMIEHLFAGLSTVMHKHLIAKQGIDGYNEVANKLLKNGVEDTIFDPIGKIKDIIDFFNPLSQGNFISRVVLLVDLFVFAFYLARRSFKLLIWKIIFPIVFLTFFFTDNKIKATASKYLMEGLRTYLTIIPFLFVNVFCIEVYSLILGGLGSITGNAVAGIIGDLGTSIFLTFIVVLKISLFKMSEHKIMDKII